MGEGVLIISEIEMVLWKNAFKHKTTHCYTTLLFSSSSAEFFLSILSCQNQNQFENKKSYSNFASIKKMYSSGCMHK